MGVCVGGGFHPPPTHPTIPNCVGPKNKNLKWRRNMRRVLVFIVISLVLAGLACNYPMWAPTPTPTSPPPTPASTATSITQSPSLTPTPQPTGGTICVFAYKDLNRNAMRDNDEPPLTNVHFSIQRGGMEIQEHRSSAEDESHCFFELPPGDYKVLATAPENYQATNPSTLSITLREGKRLPVVLGFAELPSLPDGKLFIAGNVAIELVSASASGDFFFVIADNKLQLTDDGGLSWQIVGQAPPAHNVIASPADPNLLFAGDGQDCFRGGPDSPLFRSQDGGSTWEPMPSGINLRPAAAHPRNPSIAWAIGCDGVYITKDAGNSWTHQPAEEWGLYTLDLIQPAERQPMLVYAVGNSEGGSGALFRSEDGGHSWVTATDEPDLWITDLLLNPADADQVWFTTPGGIWQSTDGAATWQVQHQGLETVVVGESMQFEGRGLNSLTMASSGELYLGTAQGVFNSKDDGVTWQAIRGAPWGSENISQIVASETALGTRLWISALSGVYTYTP